MHSRRDSLHQQEQWYNFLKGIRARFKNEFLSRIVHFCKISLTCCQYFSRSAVLENRKCSLWHLKLREFCPGEGG